MTPYPTKSCCRGACAMSGMALATGPLIWPAASAVPLTKHRCLAYRRLALLSRPELRQGMVGSGEPTYLCRALWVAFACLFTALGCGTPDIDSSYGKRRGTPGAESVNGTAVLSAMFETAGHRVTTWRRLSPKLEQADTIVWVPDNFALPSLAERQFLENWLAKKPQRTLVYVGRDYDASIPYWNRMQPLAPPSQVMEVVRRAAVAQALHDKRRSKGLPTKASCDWFVVEGGLPHRTVTELEGPWATGIAPKNVQIELDAPLQRPCQRRDRTVAKARLAVFRRRT